MNLTWRNRPFKCKIACHQPNIQYCNTRGILLLCALAYTTSIGIKSKKIQVDVVDLLFTDKYSIFGSHRIQLLYLEECLVNTDTCVPLLAR